MPLHRHSCARESLPDARNRARHSHIIPTFAKLGKFLIILRELNPSQGMSKKLYSTAKWKKYLKSRQEYQLRRVQARRSRRHPIVPLRRIQPRQLAFATLVAPSSFSIIHNPTRTINFLAEFRYKARYNNLMLDLRGVTQITVDAITALIAEIVALGKARLVNGTYPDDSQCRDLLIQSGLFDYVKSRHALPKVQKGRVFRRKSKLVEGTTAKELIRIGSEAAYGSPRKCQAAYSALVECMSNTHNHATGKSATAGAQTWYSAVFGDKVGNRICYAFLDTGVGIFRSVRYNGLRRAYRQIVKGEDDRHILRDILNGLVASRTGLPFRGKGLPGIYRSLQAGRIKSLIIVANDVYADVANDDFRVLKTQFPGTLLYWES
jgi:hypothetical protein